MSIFVTVLMILAGVAPAIWLFIFSDLNLAKHKARMEKINIDHAKEMMKIQKTAGNLLSSIDDPSFTVTYIMPVKNQSWWYNLFGKIKIYPYTFNYGGRDTQSSEYTKIISKNKWFYLQLKNWSETDDREVALKAMKYLCWKRDIP